MNAKANCGISINGIHLSNKNNELRHDMDALLYQNRRANKPDTKMYILYIRTIHTYKRTLMNKNTIHVLEVLQQAKLIYSDRK